MTADEKIAESEYNLNKLRHLSVKAPEFKFELSNFLSSANSIFSHLLEEYSTKYGLILSKISYKSFLEEANKTNNSQAVKFIQWEDNEYNKIKNDQRFGFLIDKRNTNIHYHSVMPTSFRAFSKLFKFGESGQGDIDFAKGLAYFPENDKQDVRQVCRFFLDQIEKMVKEAHSRFK